MLDRAWCLCLPSRSEGLGRVVLEAMAAGRAVVATRAGGPEELVIDHESGRLVNPDDAHELADSLVDVIGNRTTAEEMGAEGRRLAEARVRWPSTRPGSNDCHAGSRRAWSWSSGVGDAAPATANRDVARTRALARHVDHLVVLDPDETWWTPVGSRTRSISWKLEPVDSRRDPRRSSLAERSQGRSATRARDRRLATRCRSRPSEEDASSRRDARPPTAVVARGTAVASRSDRGQPVHRRLAHHMDRPRGTPRLALECRRGDRSPGCAGDRDVPRSSPVAVTGAGAGPGIGVERAAPGIGVRTRTRCGWRISRSLLTDSNAADGQRHQIDAHIRNLALHDLLTSPSWMVQEASRGCSRQAHALVDIEGSDDAVTFEALLAMAHGRPVLSSREQFAPLLETALLPLRFVPGDEPQLADRMKSLAAAWSDELDSAGQTLRNAVRQEHSVTHWAESVASIVGFVRTRHRIASEVVAASERYDGVGHLAANNSAANNSSPPEAAPASTSDQPDLDVPECSPSVEDAEDPKSDEDEDEDENVNVGSRSRRWRLRR